MTESSILNRVERKCAEACVYYDGFESMEFYCSRKCADDFAIANCGEAFESDDLSPMTPYYAEAYVLQQFECLNCERIVTFTDLAALIAAIIESVTR